VKIVLAASRGLRARPPPDETGEQSDEAVGDSDAAGRISRLGIPGERGDFDSGDGSDRFTAGDG
jgi:hypothetical protein